MLTAVEGLKLFPRKPTQVLKYSTGTLEGPIKVNSHNLNLRNGRALLKFRAKTPRGSRLFAYRRKRKNDGSAVEKIPARVGRDRPKGSDRLSSAQTLEVVPFKFISFH